MRVKSDTDGFWETEATPKSRPVLPLCTVGDFNRQESYVINFQINVFLLIPPHILHCLTAFQPVFKVLKNTIPVLKYS